MTNGPAGGSLFPSDWWPLLVTAVRRQFRPWLVNWLVVVAAAAVVSLLMPKWYRATATLLPPTGESDLAMSFTNLLRTGDLAAGRMPRTSSPEDIFSAIFSSRTLAHAAVARFDLVRAYKVKRESQAMERFKDHLSVGTTKEGVVFVSVEDRSPKRAAEITNFMVEELDRFNREIRMTAGKSTRLFIERRLEQTTFELRQAEDSLRGYVMRHGPALANSQALATGASVMAQRIALQVRLETLLQTQAEGSEEVRRARAELAALDRELKLLPQTGTVVERLLRSVKIQDQVFALLTAQYEEAKVREHKDTPTVQVLDRAEAPDKKSRPRRSLIVATAAVLGLLESTLWALYRDRRVSRPAPDRA
ncbi:MAG: hypothetical protein HZB25_11980 [Candidatus Eisenbacteria bacterium]|nr:hypothetical protein [Candidatus Eisenbacteria bacterium]